MNERTVSSGRAYAGRTIDERRTSRREALIAAGIRVFGQDGFRAATVKSLCREAGLTERYFYESFANSEALFESVYKSLIADLDTEMRTAIAGAPAEAEAMSHAALRVYFRHMADPTIARIVLIEIFGISPAIDHSYRSATYHFARLTEDVTAKAFEATAPLENGRSRRLLAMGLVGATIHIAMYWHLNGYREPVDDVVGSALEIYRAVAREQDLTDAPSTRASK